MTNRSHYDDDILLWSEQQSAALRRLGETRRYSNELDIENVAEEIESVGRSELAAVKSQLRLILSHLIKLYIDPESEAAGHWQGEIFVFHGELLDRYAPSMRQRIDMDELWRRAHRKALLDARGKPEHEVITRLPNESPFTLDELVAERIDDLALAERLRERAQSESS